MAARELLVRLLAGGLIVTLLGGGPAEAAGPWKGQIVDRDTGQPIPGAVVLAIWTLRSRGEIHPDDEFHSASEVVSDDEGRFVIQEHTVTPTKTLTHIQGPEIVIFKGGYGGWGFKGAPYYPSLEDAYVRKERIARATEQFEKDGVVFELRRRTDRRERINWISLVRPLHVPDDKMPRLLQALDAEGVSLGLPPLRDAIRGGRQ
jgi:hypothetical protein